jgi:hypothetical protein
VAGKWATFHDQLAAAAQRNGATAADYQANAGKYFKGTLGMIAMGLVIGAIGSWPWGVIPCGLALFLLLQGSSDRAVATRLEQLEKTPSVPSIQ